MPLDNYEGVVRHYGAKGLKMDLTSDKGRKKYFDIRQKFWGHLRQYETNQ